MKNDNSKVFVLVGDGECQEGTTWESILIGNRLNLNNLVVIVDNNKNDKASSKQWQNAKIGKANTQRLGDEMESQEIERKI